MDGTVWDSAENVAKSWTVKVQEAGYKDRIVTKEDIQGVMGKPMDVIADILFSYTKKGPERDKLRHACETYEVEYLRENGGMLYDGVIETWTKLKKMGYHIYIVSNCQAGYIEAFLGYFGISYGTKEDLVEDIEIAGVLNAIELLEILHRSGLIAPEKRVRINGLQVLPVAAVQRQQLRCTQPDLLRG